MEKVTMGRRRPATRRVAAPLLALGMTFGILSGCGDDEVAEPLETADPVEDELISPQLSGLEVTVNGNVSELVDGNAFQVDKDGLGQEGDTSDPVTFEDDYFDDDFDVFDYYEDDDFDFYDYDYYVADDEEFDEFDERGVLVVTPGGSEVAVGDAVQVNGTLRYFDEATLEGIYDVEFDDSLYGSYEDQYVIVADAVKTLPTSRQEAEGAGGGSEGSTTTTTGATATTEAPTG